MTASSRAGSTRSPTRAAASSTARPGGDSRAARASTASRADAGSSSPVGAQDLADEERVATGQRVYDIRLVTRRLAQLGDGRGGERGEVDAPRGTERGDVAQGLAQGAVIGQTVVAVGGDHHGADSAQAARDVADQVQRGLVGEVQVLHDQHGQAIVVTVLAQHRQERGETRLARHALATRDPDRPAPLVGHVLERAEGRRREGSVAGRPGEACVEAVDEGLDEAGLADARLSGHQHEPTVVVPDVGGVFAERPELQLPLEQAHGASVRVGGTVG